MSTHFDNWLSDRFLSRIFGRTIYPGPCFKRPEWKGLAFDSEKHKLRIPERFLEELFFFMREKSGEVFVVVLPEGGVGVSDNSSVSFVDASIEPFQSFMLSGFRYTSNLWIASASEKWGVWLTSELAVACGDTDFQELVIGRFLGDQRPDSWLRSEFVVEDYEDAFGAWLDAICPK